MWELGKVFKNTVVGGIVIESQVVLNDSQKCSVMKNMFMPIAE
jgi:hypothetical protein